MKEYAITFRIFQANCEHKRTLHLGYILRTKYACYKRVGMNIVKSKTPERDMECREANCLILKKCDQLEER